MLLSQPAIAVIVVNYNTGQLALKAISSVFQSKDGVGRGIAVHLVDNASPNGDADFLSSAVGSEAWSSNVKIHAESVNLGFGCGNNVALAALARSATPPEYVMLLNPDATVTKEAIPILADFLDAHPKAAAAGAGIVGDDRAPTTAAFRFHGIASTFISALSFGPVTNLLKRWEVPLPVDISTRRVDWVSGAAVMFRMSDLNGVGYFDPGFFLYFEETDLMLRINRAGREVWFVKEAVVHHTEGASTGLGAKGIQRRRRPSYWYRSWGYYFLKNHGRLRALAAACAWYIGAVLNGLLSALRRKEPSAPIGFYGDLWTFVVRPLLGRQQLTNE